VASALGERPGHDAEKMARSCYIAALRAVAGEAPAPFSVHDCIGEFERRLAATDWRDAARQPGNFIRSPRALVRWAPIADKLKKYDSDTLENSVKFTWLDICEQFDNRLDAGAVSADWLRPAAT
ncbi:MAG: hypothetical protein ACRECC_12420, partial [Pseudolabrys sp.]